MSVDVFRIGRIWHYRFQVRPNPRVQRSTRLSNKAAAQIVADRAYNNAVERANGGQPVPTLAEVIADWFELRAAHSSPAHIRSVDTFKRLHQYKLGGMLISQIDTTAVERARAEHLKTHNYASTNHWLRILKLLVSWAVKRKILPRLPWDVAMLTVQKKPRVMLPLAVVQNWFAAIDRAGQRTPAVSIAARLMLWLGLRESETITAQWEWIDWERITYTPGITKGREADPLPMLLELVDYLVLRKQVEGLMVCHADGTPYGPGYMRTAIRSANKACGIKGVTPHRLRGTIATWLSENGVPAQDVQKFLRHKDIRTTMGYLEQNMDRVSGAQGRIAKKAGYTGRKNGEQP